MCDDQIKLFLLGDSGVGKSCLLSRFINDHFAPSMIPQVGIDFKVRTIELNEKKMQLQIWDPAGQERFIESTSQYYKGTKGFLLIYDITNEDSFSNILKWILLIEENVTLTKSIKILVGSKCDMEDKRVVDSSRGKALADKYAMGFIETSAKTNHNVDLAFVILMKLIMQSMDVQSDESVPLRH